MRMTMPGGSSQRAQRAVFAADALPGPGDQRGLASMRDIVVEGETNQ
jgi:hypothetical protein